MSLDDTQSWLETTQHHGSHEPETSSDDRGTKRRRLSDWTPPFSCQENTNNDEINQPQLRHLIPPETATIDSPGATKRQTDDETPRAKRVQSSSERSFSLSERSLHSRSGRASPLKQMLKLRHDRSGLDMRELQSFADMPEALDTLLNKIEAFVDGKGIASTSASPSGGGDFLTDDPSVAGCTPLPEDVLDATAAAVECSNKRHPVATWNIEVHQLVLSMAFRPPGQRRFRQLVNLMGSTTAAIMPEYGSPTASKKVDFCVYVEPENDPTLSNEYRAAAERMRDALPQEVLNFTDFAPLDDRFVAISIETKKPSENVEAGQLQLGVWEMARWKFLRRLAAGYDNRADDQGISAAAALASKLPEFLPGIVIQGQEWFIVVTTAEGGRTVLWRKMFIGSTANTRGIYQIVRTLQYLGQWVRDIYWPCVRSMLEHSAES